MRLLISLCALAATAAPAVALDDPNQLVKSLYRLPEVPSQHQDIDRFFSRDLAAALKRDLTSGRPGGYRGVDWRFEGEDEEVVDLYDKRNRIRTAPRVRVDFNKPEQTTSIVYELCLAPQGWRISNVQSKAGDMRLALDVPIAPIAC